MKETTRKKYERIARNFDRVVELEKKSGGKFKDAVLKFLESSSTKNTFRVRKAAIRFWIVGYCIRIPDPERKREIRKKMERILENTVDDVKSSKTFAKRKGYRYTKKLTKEKILKIFKNESISDKHKTLILLMILTGCRPAEFKNLQIYTDRGFLVIKRKVFKKTTLSEKYVILQYKLEDIQPLLFFKFEFQGYTEDTIRKIFQRISKRTGIKIRPYSCRNFFSSEMKKMFSPDQVAILLGHEKGKNQQFYARSTKSDTFLPRPSFTANFEPKMPEQFISPEPEFV